MYLCSYLILTIVLFREMASADIKNRDKQLDQLYDDMSILLGNVQKNKSKDPKGVRRGIRVLFFDKQDTDLKSLIMTASACLCALCCDWLV